MPLLQDLLRYNDCDLRQAKATLNTAGVYAERAMSPEEMEKENALREARHKEEYRRNIACCVVDVAEELVTKHNINVPAAFEIAKELADASREFVKNYKLPETN